MLSIVLFLCFTCFLSIKADDCQYNTTDGVLDLRVFGKKSGPKYLNIPDTDSTANRIYSFNGCFSYSTDSNCKDAAACITDTQTKVSKTIARQDGRTFIYNTGLSQITYTDGLGNQLLLILTCQTSSSVKAHQSGDTSYVMYIEDECACPGKCTYHGDGDDSSGLGGGAIFFIIFITIIGVYLLFGVLFLRFARNRQGLDMIPHRTFWVQMGKDSIGGARFIVRKVKGSSSDYQSV